MAVKRRLSPGAMLAVGVVSSTTTFEGSGRTWSISWTPGLEFLAPAQICGPVSALVVGLLLTLLVCVLLLLGVRRTRRLEAEIAERRLVEAELADAKASAETASRAKGEFLANMSHEIRTPINGVLGMVELALDTNLTVEQRRYLTAVKESADALLTIVNDILDFSKIEAGKLEITPIAFRLYDCVASTVSAFGPKADQKGLELTFCVDSDVPDCVIGDPGRLRQVLNNLVSNAIKFTEKGEVSVRVGLEETQGRDVCVRFDVEDTGIGIPASKQEAIFEAFRQADSSMTMRFGGTGLGLTITRQLVELMGGRVWLESREGQGSRFHVTARFEVQNAPVEKIRPEMGTQDLAGLPVLIVDDNQTNCEILSDMLSRWRMAPTVVCSGTAALYEKRRAQENGRPFPLVLLDICMPWMTGFEVAKAIKLDEDLAKATVMMLSSVGRRGDAVRCERTGVEAYLCKPILRSDLQDAILVALGARKKGEHGPIITRHSLREGRRLHILLAEDNKVNQEFVMRLLAKRGHKVIVASNGKEAVAAADSSDIDLVFMDIQMPEMNGLEAARAIRGKEAGTGRRVPVIAMTARAMKGDKEQCLEAGMDGYISKPVNRDDLFEIVRRFTRMEAPQQETPVPAPATAPVRTSSQPPYDRATALRQVDGDAKLLKRLAETMLEDAPRMLAALQQAMTKGYLEGIAREAHKLRGASGVIRAHRAAELAGSAEHAAQSGDLAGAQQAVSSLAVEINRLLATLAADFGLTPAPPSQGQPAGLAQTKT